MLDVFGGNRAADFRGILGFKKCPYKIRWPI